MTHTQGKLQQQLQQYVRFCLIIPLIAVIFVCGSLTVKSSSSLYPSSSVSSSLSSSSNKNSILQTGLLSQQDQTEESTNDLLTQYQYNDDAVDSLHSAWQNVNTVKTSLPSSSVSSLSSMISSFSIKSQNLRRSIVDSPEKRGAAAATTIRSRRTSEIDEEQRPSILDFITAEKSNSPEISTISATVTNRTLTPYHKITSGANGVLGIRNYNVTNGNPLKGLALNPLNTPGFRPTDDLTEHPYNGTKRIEHSLEAWYIGIDMVQVDYNQFNWTYFNERLDDTWDRGCHSIPRFIFDYPGEPLHMPPFLLQEPNKVQLREIHREHYGKSFSPVYTDPNLLRATESFIKELGRLYDDDQRIAYIQMGIVGFWGEWHTNGEDNLFNETVTDNVLKWYNESFDKTPIQGRYPTEDIYNTKKMGYHDDSFTHSTLDGKYNGGFNESYFFMNQVKDSNQLDFWKYGPMGGEVRPITMRIIHDPNAFPTNTRNHQDFLSCILETHATYIRNSYSFSYNNTELTSSEIINARYASSRMGYSFQITEIDVSEALVTETNRIPKQINTSAWVWQSNLVDIVVTIQQVGIAPIYYPITMRLYCNNKAYSATPDSGRNLRRKLIDQFQSTKVLFRDVPATDECIGAGVRVQLESYMFHPSNPIKFAQGDTGIVQFKVPLPPSRTFATGEHQSKQPSKQPTKQPTNTPSASPTDKPISSPNSSPVSSPSPTAEEDDEPPSYVPSVAPSSAIAIPFVPQKEKTSATPKQNEKSTINIMLIDTNSGTELGLLVNNHQISYNVINTHNLTVRADITDSTTRDDDIRVSFLWTDKDGTGQVFDETNRNKSNNNKQFLLGATWTNDNGNIIEYTPSKYLSYDGHKTITVVVAKANDSDGITQETSVDLSENPGDIIAHRTIDFSFW